MNTTTLYIDYLLLILTSTDASINDADRAWATEEMHNEVVRYGYLTAEDDYYDALAEAYGFGADLAALANL